MSNPTRDGRVFFDATLRPHRSLSKRGFLLVMSAIAGLGFLIGTAFFMAGAWPVAGFAGLEIALVYWAFRLNFREGRRAEHVRLTEKWLEVTWVEPSGKERHAWMEPTWLAVDLQQRPRDDNRLLLRTHGKYAEIGGFLLPEERREIAHALETALMRFRGATA